MILSKPIDGHNAACDYCGKTFKRKPFRLRLYEKHGCSKNCIDKHKIQANTIKCENCGVMFYRVPGKMKLSKHHCCSKKCSNELHTGSLHIAYNPLLRGRTCAHCKKEIKNPQAKKYCSHQCRYKGNSGTNHVTYSENLIPCALCGKQLNVIKSFLKRNNFCSKECQNTFHSNAMRANNNPRFKHGDWLDLKKPKLLYYGFTLSIKGSIRERDNYSCVVCKMPESEHKIKLHVHHIDYNKTNNKSKNLITVCRFCHGKIHGKELIWQKILSSPLPV